MKKINDLELQKLTDKVDFQDVQITDCEINLENEKSIDLSYKSYSFKNCHFKGARIDFYDFSINDDKEEYQSLSFTNCIIENNLFIKDTSLYQLEFQETEIKSQQFHIASSRIKQIIIVGGAENYNSINSLTINDLNESETILDIRKNNFLDTFLVNNSIFKNATINANIFKNTHIYKSKFDINLTFWKNKIELYSSFQDNIFNEVDAPDCTLEGELLFKKNKFEGSCNFEKTKGQKAVLKFSECNFNGYTYFDNAKIYSLSFDSSYFKEIVSFQHLQCSKIKFNRIHFDKVALLNDTQFDNIRDIDIKTVRVIKNQLSKVGNTIDYLKYNAIEQSNLLKNSNLSFNDKILLNLNSKSNDFGNNWIKGVTFTLKRSLLFFILLLITNSFVSSRYPISLDFKSDFAPLSKTLTEYLKFVFSLGFDNKEIQSNGFLYLIFIIAKIYIGYGLYQTISAFRKYGKT